MRHPYLATDFTGIPLRKRKGKGEEKKENCNNRVPVHVITWWPSYKPNAMHRTPKNKSKEILKTLR